MYLSSLNSRWISEYLEWHENPLEYVQLPKTDEKEIVENQQDKERCEKRYENSALIETITGLSTRAMNCVKNIAADYDISTIGELRNIPDGVMLRSSNFGRKSLESLYVADVLWIGRNTTYWQVLNDKRKKIEEDRETESWMNSSIGYTPQNWDKWKNAVAHWNHYGTWPNGSTNYDDAKLYIDN